MIDTLLRHMSNTQRELHAIAKEHGPEHLPSIAQHDSLLVLRVTVTGVSQSLRNVREGFSKDRDTPRS